MTYQYANQRAAFAGYPKKTLEKFTDVKLSNQEFSNV
jgi:hypothetical protein